MIELCLSIFIVHGMRVVLSLRLLSKRIEERFGEEAEQKLNTEKHLCNLIRLRIVFVVVVISLAKMGKVIQRFIWPMAMQIME